MVLTWIKTRDKRYKHFVKNRVAEYPNVKDWEYIEGEEYIVDLASRGCYLKTLEYTKKWFNGPEWLLCEQEKWPTNDLGQHENKDQEADVEEIQR